MEVSEPRELRVRPEVVVIEASRVHLVLRETLEVQVNQVFQAPLVKLAYLGLLDLQDRQEVQVLLEPLGTLVLRDRWEKLDPVDCQVILVRLVSQVQRELQDQQDLPDRLVHLETVDKVVKPVLLDKSESLVN